MQRGYLKKSIIARWIWVGKVAFYSHLWLIPFLVGLVVAINGIVIRDVWRIIQGIAFSSVFFGLFLFLTDEGGVYSGWSHGESRE